MSASKHRGRSYTAPTVERFGTTMSLRRFVHLVALITTGLLTLPFLKVGAQQPRSVPIDFGKKDIAGVVASSKGPEAGVWVIAETTELPTKFVRIVVTDDQGRYLIPDLPRANYQIFVRGYGLLDSERQPAKPGRRLDLKAEVAPDARRAAQVYPAAWWLSTLTLPDDKEFHKKFTMDLKECFDCHQLGNKTTRELGTSAILERSEEHTSELQSRLHLVCRLLLEKKKNKEHNTQDLQKDISLMMRAQSQ